MEVARDQLKSIVQRVERLESEIADLNADKSEIYKEARANGFDVKTIKKVVSKRKLDAAEREEQDYVFETYWDAVHGTNLVHTHARENIEEFDAETGEINQPIKAEQAEPEAAAEVAGDDLREPVAAEQGQIIQEGDAPRETGCFGGDASGLDTDQPETATKQRVNVHSQHEGANAQATVQNECVTVVGTESGTVAKTAADFRPHCLRPDACGASGLTHCYSCSKQMSAQRESEDA